MAIEMSPQPHLLSERLADSFARGFFRPLARPSAPLYVDCADRLERAGDEGGQLAHEDAVVVVRETLALHPRAQLDADEGGDTQDLRLRAGKFFNKLIEARWLEPRTVSLDERWVLISPALRPLLRMLRDLAEDELAELKGFADILRGLCETLLREGALDPSCATGEEMRSTVHFLLDGVARATEQMHAVEKVILHFEERQQRSPSGDVTLRLFYTEFYEGEHFVCYDTLRQGGLLPKLHRARAVVQEALGDPFAKERLAEGLAAQRKLAPADAYNLAEQQLNRLERALGGIRAKAELIDTRVASFHELSVQRYRYQTEMRGRMPELVKAYLAAANARFAGQRFADLSEPADFQLLCPEVEIFFGVESLARSRRARPNVNLTLDEAHEGDAQDAQELIRQRSLYAITPNRAARFIEKHLPERGQSVSSADFAIHTEDDLFDLLAALAFERASGRASPRALRWRATFARAELGLEPEKIPVDSQAGHRFERFTLERLS
jgi:hypothetical protein